MKAFILMFYLGIGCCAAADDGPWYDAKGNLVRPTKNVTQSKANHSSMEVVKKDPILGASQSWKPQRRWRSSANDQFYQVPYNWAPRCNWPNQYYQPRRWRAHYRSSKVNIVISR